MSVAYKIIFLHFKKNCTYSEISDILDVDVKLIAKVIAVELCENERLLFDGIFDTKLIYSGKVKLKKDKKDDF